MVDQKKKKKRNKIPKCNIHRNGKTVIQADEFRYLETTVKVRIGKTNLILDMKQRIFTCETCTLNKLVKRKMKMMKIQFWRNI